MKATLIIAEAGVNHDGSLEKARRLVEVAAQAGADYVKFQTFSADRLVARGAPKAEYQKRDNESEDQYEMLKKLELSHQDHVALQEECRRRRIGFLSTPFDIESVELLDSMAVDFFKVPSGEITNIPYLRRIASCGRPVLLSTGMATLAEVEGAIRCLEEAGTQRSEMTVLQCTTAYPAPFADANLRAMAAMGVALGVRVGYSDHTPGIEACIAAVALGATVIEKHFTLDRNAAGPDHFASLEPMELDTLVRAVRNVELALGDGVKRPTEAETQNRMVARKGIVAARDIARGDVLSAANLTTQRPEEFLPASDWDRVMGRVASRAYHAGDRIRFDV